VGSGLAAKGKRSAKYKRSAKVKRYDATPEPAGPTLPFLKRTEPSEHPNLPEVGMMCGNGSGRDNIPISDNDDECSQANNIDHLDVSAESLSCAKI
jgi:hypothetical protein